MNELELNQKLDTVVKIAQSRILTFLKDYTNEEILGKVNDVFRKYPVILGGSQKQTNVFGGSTLIGGTASDNEIVISIEDIKSVSLDEEYELDRLLGTIIHEYAHQFRKLNSQYGKMFEEAYVSIFAETCINYSKLKNSMNQKEKPEIFCMNTSVEYKKAESQVRGLMFALRSKNLDVSMMLEYILGNEKYFHQTCSQVFGTDFDIYYAQASELENNRQNSNPSEQLLTELLAKYIKSNHISVKKCYENSELELSHLYSINSPVFRESVVMAGKDALRPEEQNLYQYFEYSSRVDKEEKQFLVDEKRTRIQNMINQKYGLTGKSPEQLHETLMDICSDYIQLKNRTDEEGMIYLEEVKNIIPNIEEFASTFKQLRISGMDKKVIENLDFNNLSYSSLFTTMDSLIPKPQPEIQNSSQTNTVAHSEPPKEISPEYSQNNSVEDFRNARMSEIEKRSIERNQQLAYAISKKMNPSELEQYAQSVGGYKK